METFLNSAKLVPTRDYPPDARTETEGALVLIARLLDTAETTLTHANARLETNLARIFCAPCEAEVSGGDRPSEGANLPEIIERLERLTRLAAHTDALTRRFAEQV